jgi:hypothetical protein
MTDRFEGATKVVMFEGGYARTMVLEVARLTKTQVVTVGGRRWWRGHGGEVGASGYGSASINELTERTEELARRDTAIRTLLSAASLLEDMRRQENKFAGVGLAELEEAAGAARSIVRLIARPQHRKEA